jgi:hypothetical protein
VTRHAHPVLVPLPFTAFVLACAVAHVAPARAAPSAEGEGERRSPTYVEDESPALDPRADRLDSAPHELWAAPPTRALPLWFAVQLGVAQLAGGERSFSGMLLAGIPLERLTERRAPAADRAVLAEVDAPRLKPAPSAKTSRSGPSSEPVPDPAAAAPPPQLAEVEPPLPLPVRITPDAARAAVDAALRHARLVDPEARIDAIVARARSSALLPELRLRISRLVDEAENLAPAEYDPERRTASGGTSLWLEARATWRLDRLVFADDEIALERIRRERAEAQAKLAERVLGLLFSWQRAVALEADPGRTPEERRAAALEAIEAEASLDILTGGWLTQWRKPRP